MGKSKRKSSGGLRTIFSLITLILAVAALVMLALPVVTATKDPFTISATGFTFAFGGKWLLELSSGSTSGSTNMLDIPSQTGILILFILITVAIVCMVINLFVCILGKSKSLKVITAILAFFLLIASGVMFFLTKTFVQDVTTVTIFGISRDFSDKLSLGYGSIMGGIFACLGGVSAAVSAVLR